MAETAHRDTAALNGDAGPLNIREVADALNDAVNDTSDHNLNVLMKATNSDICSLATLAIDDRNTAEFSAPSLEHCRFAVQKQSQRRGVPDHRGPERQRLENAQKEVVDALAAAAETIHDAETGIHQDEGIIDLLERSAKRAGTVQGSSRGHLVSALVVRVYPRSMRLQPPFLFLSLPRRR
jgi:hypothetical protein